MSAPESVSQGQSTGTEPAGGGARRDATVVFADISGFTAMSEKLDPEDVTAIMNGCFALMEATIHAYGGTVDKYIGDCIMASFGVPVAAGDHPARAVNAALALRLRLEEFNRERELPVPLRTHVGVNSGTVLAGHVGGEVKRELTVVGEVVDVADVLKDVAPHGAIWVGDDTHRRTRDVFAYGPRTRAVRHGREVHGYALLTEAPTDAGATVAARDATADAPERESDRRRATVVFAEIGGLGATGDPTAEELALANRCFAAMEEAVRQHGGTVDKFLGGIVMALFGAPLAIEDAPKQALNAAIEMRRRLDAFARAHDRALTLHAGVNSGLVLAGMVGGEAKRDFTVMGDTVNLASRLKDAAPEGAILVGPETHRFTREHFDFGAPRTLALKGKEKTVRAYELRSAARRLHRGKLAGSNRLIFSPLIGRAAEVAAVGARLERLRAGEGGAVSIVAEAGLGKSRLVAEITGLERFADVAFLEGRSVAMGAGLSFHPFVDLFRRWAGIGEEEADAPSLRKLAARVRDLAPDAGDELVPFVATLMGLDLEGAHRERVAGIEGEALEKLILHAVRTLLQRLAAAHPLVLVFEDLHWADLSSIKLLESLIGLAGDHAILFLLASRPDHPETTDRVVDRAAADLGAHHLGLRLEPLGNKECDELVGNLLRIDNLPFSTRALISRRAEGNPFYIEEVVRSLIDQGIVRSVGDRLELTAEIDAATIPGTVQEVIMARVDRLPGTTRQVLQLAAVLGRTFPARIVHDVLGRVADCAAELASLVERQLVRPRTAAGGAAVEIEYTFQHALVQETVYGSILQRTRRELHLQAAETIERTFADRLPDFYGVLAYHFGRAEHLAKAEEYLFKAGDEAARAAASNEALNFFREAARLYDLLHPGGGDPGRKALLEKNIGLALIARGRLPEAVEHLDGALGYLGEPMPHGTLQVRLRFAADAAAVLAHLYLRGGRPGRRAAEARDRDVLEVRYNRARAQTTSDPQRFFFDTIGTLRRMNQLDPATVDDASGMYAGTAILFSYSGVSFAVARKILGIARGMVRPDNPRDEFVYRHYEWIHHYIEGDWSPRWEIEDPLIERNIRLGQLWDVQTYLGMLGEQRVHQGALAAAAAIRERLREIADGYGLDWARSNQYANEVWVLMQRRDLTAALTALERYYRSRDEELLNLLALGARAKIEILQGNRAAAAISLARAEELVRPGVVAPYYLTFTVMSRLLYELAGLEGALGGDSRPTVRTATRRATRSLRAALSVAASVSWERTEAFRLAGRLAWLRGRRERALRWWTRSIAEGERLGASPEVARTYLEAGRRLEEDGRGRVLTGRDAAGCLAAARAIFAAVGLALDVEDAATARQRAA